MALAVAWREEILWMNAYGMADKEKRIPATPQTSYALGSLSKSISATGVMTLVEKGILDLEQPVNPLLNTVPLDRNRKSRGR
jgi:CubicO group peptidase (beta-lactamase class C family)